MFHNPSWKVCSSRGTLSAIAHGGNPQDRIATPRNASCFKPGNPTPVATTEGTSLRVHQSPTAGNPPTLRERLRRTGLDSPQRTGSTFRKI
ncbi:hypothetical protein [Nostoc sp. 106C]|uniref:hypothetical protein n=1 Tax=Nostoc sp. 106C TaxID=1932667 RepID=UPI00117EB5D7|nr:hypothetical protein [Nostoc sp. 106C]